MRSFICENCGFLEQFNRVKEECVSDNRGDLLIVLEFEIYWFSLNTKGKRAGNKWTINCREYSFND